SKTLMRRSQSLLSIRISLRWTRRWKSWPRLIRVVAWWSNCAFLADSASKRQRMCCKSPRTRLCAIGASLKPGCCAILIMRTKEVQANEWEKISELLDHALALTEADRCDYLAEIARAEGEAISNEVKALLEADRDSEGFLQTSAFGMAARQLAVNANDAERIQLNTKYGN